MLTRCRAVAFVLVVGVCTSASALGIRTHALVNREAAIGSARFDQHLRAALGLSEGPSTRLRHGAVLREVVQWLEDGGEREDDYVRFVHHFHDPLRPLDGAGLGIGPVRFNSSLKWMHEPTQEWGWPAARRLYYAALIETEPLKREALWAVLFRALGQIMHLVVDASVPEHTRNDIHPVGALKLGNSYENWVGRQHEGSTAQEAQFVARYLGAPIGFAEELLESGGTDGEPAELLPVARLVDADRYTGTNPGVTVGADSRSAVAVGLAEIANANFFSEDTLRDQYPSPSDAGLIAVNLTTPVGKVRRYFSRPAGQGLLPVNPLKAECASDAIHLRGVPVGRAPYPCVDPLVWNQVAMQMLPRAVGYARGVLDYFFRGSVRVHGVIVDNPVPGVDIPGRTGIWIDIENTSRERMEGVFEVYARLQRGTAHEERFPSATVNGGAPVAIEPGAIRRLRLAPIPGHATGSQLLVFRGRLGSEEDAVAGQVFAVPYIHAVQQFYNGAISRTCTSTSSSTNDVPLNAWLFCSWQPSTHWARGSLITNLRQDDVADSSAPAIDRVRAFWTGPVSGPARLTIDGVEHADGVWRRIGNEMNPSAFLVTDTIPRRDSRLMLGVSVRGHTSEFTTQLATFKDVLQTSAEKRVLRVSSQEKWFVYGIRRTRVRLNLDTRRHETLAIGGYPSPTPLTLTGMHSSIPFLAHQSVNVTSLQADQWVIDPFEVVPMSPDADYTTPWEAIPLDAPFPAAPALHWSAELRPRPLDEMTEQFWQTFVSDQAPPSDLLLLKGDEARP